MTAQFDIHPQSKLGMLRSAVEKARTAREATAQQLATLAVEAGDLDRWIDGADLDTKPSDYATKSARRSILANVMGKLSAEQAEQAQVLKPLDDQYRRLEESYEHNKALLVRLEDFTSPSTRAMTIHQIDTTRKDMTAWLQEWTAIPEAVEVGDGS